MCKSTRDLQFDRATLARVRAICGHAFFGCEGLHMYVAYVCNVNVLPLQLPPTCKVHAIPPPTHQRHATHQRRRRHPSTCVRMHAPLNTGGGRAPVPGRLFRGGRHVCGRGRGGARVGAQGAVCGDARRAAAGGTRTPACLPAFCVVLVGLRGGLAPALAHPLLPPSTRQKASRGPPCTLHLNPPPCDFGTRTRASRSGGTTWRPHTRGSTRTGRSWRRTACRTRSSLARTGCSTCTCWTRRVRSTEEGVTVLRTLVLHTIWTCTCGAWRSSTGCRTGYPAKRKGDPPLAYAHCTRTLGHNMQRACTQGGACTRSHKIGKTKQVQHTTPRITART